MTSLLNHDGVKRIDPEESIVAALYRTMDGVSAENLIIFPCYEALDVGLLLTVQSLIL
jgi:hypothetical protein